MTDGIKAAIREHLLDELFFGDPAASLADDEDLYELGLDSMGITRLVVFVERRLKVALPDSVVVAEHFASVDAIVALVASRS